MVSKIEKLRDLFLLAFFLLVIFIIFTPVLVRNGLSILPQEILESILLLIQVSAAWQIFRLYEKTVQRREKDIQRLEKEYQKREKELLEAFAYLGKMNVQVSLIKTFLQKVKAPADQKEAENYVKDILKIVLSLARKKWVTLRIIDSNSLQTVSEYWEKINPDVDTQGLKIGNKEIVKISTKKAPDENNEYYVFSSAKSDLTPQKAYLVFLNGEKIEADIADFFRAAANQCAVLLTLSEFRGKR